MTTGQVAHAESIKNQAGKIGARCCKKPDSLFDVNMVCGAGAAYAAFDKHVRLYGCMAF